MLKCEVSGCDRKKEGRGMCKSHNQRRRSGRAIYCNCGEPVPLRKMGGRGKIHPDLCDTCYENRICEVAECNEKQFQKKMCSVHYMRWYRGSLDTVRKGQCFCGKMVTGGNSLVKYCPEHRIAIRRAASRASQARRRASISSPYHIEEVYELDGGVCYLCYNSVQMGEFWLDHIIPISRGGEDCIENVATSHAKCNMKKGSKNLEQVSLIFERVIFPDRFIQWQQ